MAKFSDVLLIGGLAGLAYIVWRSGRDLFGAFGGGIPSVELPKIDIPELPKLPNIFPSSGFEQTQPTQEFFDTEALPDPNPTGQGVRIKQFPDGSVTTVLQGVPIEDIRTPQGEKVTSPLSLFDFVNRFASKSPMIESEPDMRETPNVTSEIDNQMFSGGGPSFIGGTVREIPISQMSLGDIIDRFNVTASQASDIRSRARDDFGDFDFGTNRGLGIGSVVSEIPEIRAQIPELGNNVSNPEFEGLSATEIAKRLTGGNISNF